MAIGSSNLQWHDIRDPLGWWVGAIVFLGHVGLSAVGEYWVSAAFFMILTLIMVYIGAKKIRYVRIKAQLRDLDV